jgi:serine/threonine-protein kinase HipA
MPDTRSFDLDTRLGAFGIARFDVEDGLRVPVHTLAGALQVDFRLPSAVDYTTLLRATRLFTRDEHQMDVCGEGRAITRAHLLRLAGQGGLDRVWAAAAAVERMADLAGRFSTMAAGRSIRAATVKRVRSAIEANRLRLA